MMIDQQNTYPFRVLVADDEKATRQGLRFLIQENDQTIEVLEATNGLQCWEMLCEVVQPAQLAFIDIRMPGMDGLMICEKARAQNLPIKIVIISGFRDFEYARLALRYGVADYLLKPVNPSDVALHVRELQAQGMAAADPLKEKQERLVIERVRTWIHNHLHEEITLNDLAEKLCYAPSYLSALFKKETGKGFLEYLIDCRVQRARHLLLDPSLRISDIAIQVGYTNAKAFSIAFRKAYNITPTEYRERRTI
jgi:YesN/AraC family two-component response regulator